MSGLPLDTEVPEPPKVARAVVSPLGRPLIQHAHLLSIHSVLETGRMVTSLACIGGGCRSERSGQIGRSIPVEGPLCIAARRALPECWQLWRRFQAGYPGLLSSSRQLTVTGLSACMFECRLAASAQKWYQDLLEEQPCFFNEKIGPVLLQASRDKAKQPCRLPFGRGP